MEIVLDTSSFGVELNQLCNFKRTFYNLSTVSLIDTMYCGKVILNNAIHTDFVKTHSRSMHTMFDIYFYLYSGLLSDQPI